MMIAEEDEIVSIEYIGERETIDINVTGNRLFYANGILTHNSAVDELEFDHSHISGGISKINTADNVFGIFTSKAMREQGRYQMQLMKTRSSAGVGQKVELNFNVDTLRITDPGLQTNGNGGYAHSAQPQPTITQATNSAVSITSNVVDQPKVVAEVKSAKLQSLLSKIKK